MTRRQGAVVVICGALAATFQSGMFAQNSQPAACTVGGLVTAGRVPLPGVVLSLIGSGGQTGDATQTLDLSSSGPDGTYTLKAPALGHYLIKGELAAFATLLRELVVDETTCHARVDLEMTLASRAQALSAATPGATQPVAASGATPLPTRVLRVRTQPEPPPNRRLRRYCRPDSRLSRRLSP